jgi:succinylglutamate desuccinylase
MSNAPSKLPAPAGKIFSPALKQKGGVYLSAGIHGDEAAATEGLYGWAEIHAAILPELPVMIFPCLNPWGLLSNRRTDSENRDLNRSYHLNELPRIRAQKDLIQRQSFRLTMCLHEDYDARGVYLYEACLPKRLRSTNLGQRIKAQIAMVQRAVELSSRAALNRLNGERLTKALGLTRGTGLANLRPHWTIGIVAIAPARLAWALRLPRNL